MQFDSSNHHIVIADNNNFKPLILFYFTVFERFASLLTWNLNMSIFNSTLRQGYLELPADFLPHIAITLFICLYEVLFIVMILCVC